MATPAELARTTLTTKALGLDSELNTLITNLTTTVNRLIAITGTTITVDFPDPDVTSGGDIANDVALLTSTNDVTSFPPTITKLAPTTMPKTAPVAITVTGTNFLPMYQTLFDAIGITEGGAQIWLLDTDLATDTRVFTLGPDNITVTSDTQIRLDFSGSDLSGLAASSATKKYYLKIHDLTNTLSDGSWTAANSITLT